MTRIRPLLVIGTRPEAIKMAPVVVTCCARSEQIGPFGDGHAAERIVEWILEPYRS
jgi:UDP-N-acetylglucosamine 2-epimerase